MGCSAGGSIVKKEKSGRIRVNGTERWMKDPHSAMMVLHAHKVIHCSIPRVGCSRWRRLLRRMEGYKDYLASPHNILESNGLKLTSSLSPDFVEKVLNDDSYFRFAVVRFVFSPPLLQRF